MSRSFPQTAYAALGAVAIAMVSLPVAAQDAPLALGVPVAAPKPVVKPVAAQPPVAQKTRVATADPARNAKPKKPVAAKPVAKTSAPAVPPEARRAALIAAMTGQATPPVHHHVLQDIKTTCPGNPDAIGISKVIKVDTTGGFYVGQTYHTRMPLEPKDVVLTFDDGPMANRTDRVLAALDHECTKATFFIVGQMAKAYPETLRKTAAAGHTIGYHTMTHPLNLSKMPLAQAQDNVRTGWQTVDQILYGAVGDKPATPFFRYPGLFTSRALNEWFNGMDMGVFTIDAAGNDWLKGHLTMADGPNVMNEALKELEARQGGILLLHDIKDSSSSIVAPLLRELKARGFRIVHMVPKNPPPKLISGPVAGRLPSLAETWVPVAERGIDGYDLSKQMAQQTAGRNGTLPTTPLPAYDAARPATAPAAGAVPEVTRSIPAKADAAARTTSAAPAPVEAAPMTTAAPVVEAKSTVRSGEAGWFTSTASSLRGFASAAGLW
jgi:peptidoglycan/xylan/chitin deacetylase (PgdA/CDA1 family)